MYAAWPSLVNPYVANNDAPQHLIWLFDVQWGEPFYAATSGKIQPWGYGLLCRILALIFSPYAISNWGPILTVGLVVYYGYRALSPFVPYAVALAGAMLLGHLSYPPMVGFFSRSFCLPMLVMFSAYWLRGNVWGIAASWVLSALFYPAALLITLGIAGIYLPFILLSKGQFLKFRLQGSQVIGSSTTSVQNQYSFRNAYTILAAAALIAICIVLAKSTELRSDTWIGPFVTQTDILTQPAYTHGGRVNFVHEVEAPTLGMLNYTLHHHLKWPGSPWIYYGSILLLIGISIKNQFWPNALTNNDNIQRLPFNQLLFFFLAMATSAGILHGLAQVVVPQLFIPDRFLSYPGALLAGLLMITVIGNVPSWWASRWGSILLPVLLLVFIYQNRRIYNESLTDYSWMSPVYEHLATLPEGSLIAAPPQVADNLPYFSQRSSFISNESAHALYFQGYHAFIDPRWRDFIKAYTATPDELELLKTFAQKYRITHILVDRIRLAKGEFYAFEPYLSIYQQRTAGKSATDYLLLNLPPNTGTPITERYLLIDVNEL